MRGSPSHPRTCHPVDCALHDDGGVTGAGSGGQQGEHRPLGLAHQGDAALAHREHLGAVHGQLPAVGRAAPGEKPGRVGVARRRPRPAAASGCVGTPHCWHLLRCQVACGLAVGALESPGSCWPPARACKSAATPRGLWGPTLAPGPGVSMQGDHGAAGEGRLGRAGAQVAAFQQDVVSLQGRVGAVPCECMGCGMFIITPGT